MAKTAAPKVPYSVRVSPDIAGEIEALVTATGKSKSDVVEGLVRAGLDATKPGRTSSDSGGEMLAQVLAAVAELKPTGAGNGEVLALVEELGASIESSYDEVKRRNEQFAETVAADTVAMRKEFETMTAGLKLVLTAVVSRLFPTMKPEELEQMVKKKFES